MKWLAVALLVLNIGFLGWVYNETLSMPDSRGTTLKPLPAGVASLTLVSELAEPPALRAGAAAVEPGTDAPAPAETGSGPDESIIVTDTNSLSASAQVCITAGPLATRAEVDTLQTWLATRAVRILLETKTVRTRQLYWIFLEPVDDSEAKQQVRDLQTKGVQDYLLIRRGGLNNAISLGLFSSQEAVNVRLAEMQRQGFKPVVVPRYETRDEHWLRAELGVGFEDLREIPAELGVNVNVVSIPCAAVAAG